MLSNTIFHLKPHGCPVETSAFHIYTCKISANIPVVCLTARFSLRFSDLETAGRCLCFQGRGKTCGLQVQEHRTKDKSSCSKHCEIPCCMHHLQGKLAFPHTQHVLETPSDFEKCSFTLPTSLFFFPIPQVLGILKCYRPWNRSQFLWPTSRHTKLL